MNQPSDPSRDDLETQQPLAIELANLRNHFSPISTASLNAGMASGTEAFSGGDTLVDRRSPLPLDNAFVQQTKDQIREIVETIASLAHAPIDPDDFVAAVLPKIASAMGAVGSALWQQFPNDEWQLMGGFQLPAELTRGDKPKEGESVESLSSFEKLDFLESQLNASTQSTEEADAVDDHSDDQRQPSDSHLAILNAVARERQPILIPPRDAMLQRDRPANPIAQLLIYAPLPIPKEIGLFWLQVVQSPSGGPSSHRGYLRFVAQMADLISDYFRSHRLRVFERDREYLAIAEHTMNELAGNFNPKLGVAKLMKTVREHARSEHAFLLHKPSRFGRWQVVGAAGLVDIDRRAVGIGQIERAATSLQYMAREGGTLVAANMTDEVDARDPDLNQLIHTFAISELQWIKPLSQNPATTIHNDPWPHLHESSLKHDVALLLIWTGMDKPPSRCHEQSALIAKLGLSALQVSWWKKALLARRTTHASVLTFANPGMWSRTWKWLACLAILSAIMAIPVPIQLNATAVMFPEVQQHVYAPTDSVVESVFVEHGKSVKEGDLLLRLKSPSLSLEWEQSQIDKKFKSQRLDDIKARLLRETALTPLQQDQLIVESKEIESGLLNDEKKIALLQIQLDLLDIRANIDGIVSTWSVQDSLRDRPIKTGQWLLTVHQSESPWVMEASLPERDAQEFRNAIDNQVGCPIATLTGFPQVQLPVRLSSTTSPRIEYVQQGNSVSDPYAASLRLRFEVETTNLPEEAAVAGATARISIPVGKGPLIWALGKDFLSKVWTKIQLWI